MLELPRPCQAQTHCAQKNRIRPLTIRYFVLHLIRSVLRLQTQTRLADSPFPLNLTSCIHGPSAKTLLLHIGTYVSFVAAGLSATSRLCPRTYRSVQRDIRLTPKSSIFLAYAFLSPQKYQSFRINRLQMPFYLSLAVTVSCKRLRGGMPRRWLAEPKLAHHGSCNARLPPFRSSAT